TLRPLRSTTRLSWLVNSLICGSSSSGKAFQRAIASPLFPPVRAGISLAHGALKPSRGLATHRDAASQDLSSRGGGARERQGAGVHRRTPTRLRSSVPPATPCSERNPAQARRTPSNIPFVRADRTARPCAPWGDNHAPVRTSASAPPSARRRRSRVGPGVPGPVAERSLPCHSGPAAVDQAVRLPEGGSRRRPVLHGGEGGPLSLEALRADGEVQQVLQ